MRRFIAYGTLAAAIWLAACPVFANGPAARCGLWLPEGAACPLKHTDVKAVIEGFAARVTVTQRYENPTDRFIEAVYTFPLSDKGAVDAMTMTIGDRTIKGVVEEKAKAQALYEAAKSAGKAASLLDQERPNIFTQSVANIPPGETVDIVISYVEILPYAGGEYTFTFPMTVGPRYNPAQVTDSARITPPVAAEGTRAGHDIALDVTLDAGVPVLAVRSELHAVSVDEKEDAKARIRLQQQDNIPNRDFILKYAVAADRVRDAVLTTWDDGYGYAALVLQPPAPKRDAPAASRELIFVIDCSGSMHGFPLEKARATMSQCLEALRPGDTFNLMNFAGGVGMCFPESVLATRDAIATARTYLDGLEGGGGTEMMKAIDAAIATPVEADRLRLVCFMTDGFIGNDYEILAAVKKHVGQTRVFSFGIGNSVNAFLIEGMAREGRGAAEIVTLATDGDKAADRFADRVQSPVLWDIAVKFEGCGLEQVAPSADRLPDLFDAQPLVILGRYGKPGKGTAIVTGMTPDGPFERRIDLNLPDNTDGPSPLRALWAREQVAALMHEDWLSLQHGGSNDRIKNEITRLGMEHSLVTPLTSFIAIEERILNKDGRVETIAVPVEMADGVSHDGVFGGVAARGRSESLGFGLSPAAAPPATPAQESFFDQTVSEKARPLAGADQENRPQTAPEPHTSATEERDDVAFPGKVTAELAKRLSAEPNALHAAVLTIEGLTDARLEAIRALGVRVGAVDRGTGRAMVRITAAQLKQVMLLDYVTKADIAKR